MEARGTNADGILAAQALQVGATVVTRNLGHLSQFVRCELTGGHWTGF